MGKRKEPVPLTIEQAEMVSQNHNLIFLALHRMGLPTEGNVEEDWYGVAAIALCRAARNYDPERGYTFSTFAMRVIHNGLAVAIRDRNSGKKIPPECVSSYNKIVPIETDKDQEYSSLLPSPTNVERQVLTKVSVEKVKSKMTEKENRVLTLAELGYSNEDIGKIIGVSHSRITQIKAKFKKKYEREGII